MRQNVVCPELFPAFSEVTLKIKERISAEQRRFSCAETHHAKYVLLGFSYKADPKVNEFPAKAAP